MEAGKGQVLKQCERCDPQWAEWVGMALQLGYKASGQVAVEEVWLSRQNSPGVPDIQGPASQGQLHPYIPHMPPMCDVSSQKVTGKVSEQKRNSKVKRLKCSRVIQKYYIHRPCPQRWPLVTPGILWCKAKGLSTRSCSGCHSTAPCSKSSRRSAGGRGIVST